MSQGKRFLFVMWDGGGTVPPILGLARRAIACGHRITVLGDPTIEHEAVAVGCGFTPWRSAPHRTTLRPEDDLLKDWETRNPLAMLARARDRFIAGPAARYAADTLNAIAAHCPDAIVSDFMIFGAHIAAEKAKLPEGALVPNIWLCCSAGSCAACSMTIAIGKTRGGSRSSFAGNSAQWIRSARSSRSWHGDLLNHAVGSHDCSS